MNGYDRDIDGLRGLACADLRSIILTASARESAACELVVIALPVSAALDVLDAIAPHLQRARLVIDVGSTKRSIVAAAERLGIGARFVGCHPMAGDHRFGWAASRAGLFVGAPVYVCPSPGTTDAALAMARDLWQSLGARPCTIDAAAHDERLAWTSHLPHAVASALALSLDSASVTRAELGPGGREMTRVSGSSPEMWTQIAIDNAAALVPALDAMEARLRDLGDRIERNDVAAVREWFGDGRNWFARSEGLDSTR